MLVRERLESDLEECTELARSVRETDRYPVYLPSDLRGFVAVPDALAVWVAEQCGEIVGHVALRPRSSEAVMAVASKSLGLAPERLGVVARLLVSARHRRHGIGATLLEVAAQEAWARGLWPILDVVCDHAAAVLMYEASGWARAGQVTARWGDHPEVQELVFVAPARSARACI